MSAASITENSKIVAWIQLMSAIRESQEVKKCFAAA
ncbi:DUF3967 domain-containing protein [Heyndrickxia camelliae]